MKEKFKAQKVHSPAEHVIYNILRTWPADRGFTPVTNPIKLKNGQTANQAFNAARSEVNNAIRWDKSGAYVKSLEATFGEGLFTADILKLIQEKTQ